MVFSAFMNQSHIHISKYYKTFIFSNNGKLLYGMYVHKIEKTFNFGFKVYLFGVKYAKHISLVLDVRVVSFYITWDM